MNMQTAIAYLPWVVLAALVAFSAAILALSAALLSCQQERRDALNRLRQSEEERDDAMNELHNFVLAQDGKTPPNAAAITFSSIHSARANAAIAAMIEDGLAWNGATGSWQ